MKERKLPSSISFEELHEKLLNFEASLLPNKPEPSYFPTSANPTSRNTTTWRLSNPSVNNTPWRPSNNNNNRSSSSSNGASMSNAENRPSRPYLGYYQICRIQGHTAKRCPSVKLIPIQPTTNSNASAPTPTTPWQPRQIILQVPPLQLHLGSWIVVPLII